MAVAVFRRRLQTGPAHRISPVPVGSRIRLHGSVSSVDDAPGDGVQVHVDCTVEVEGSPKPACVAQAVYRYYA